MVEYRRIPVEYRWNTGGIPAVRSPEILPDLTLPVYTCLFFVRGESTAEEGVRGRWWLGEARGATSKNCSASTRPVDPWSSGTQVWSPAMLFPPSRPTALLGPLAGVRVLLRFGPFAGPSYPLAPRSPGLTGENSLFVCLFVCLFLTHAHQLES